MKPWIPAFAGMTGKRLYLPSVDKLGVSRNRAAAASSKHPTTRIFAKAAPDLARHPREGGDDGPGNVAA
ncbi:hypothetical protein IEQ11_09085 [Lysobacter capsici]|uniref:hypothetical protein n=1 Tax=Lysobacter capsici TaxID=435897 RepID=UPI001782B021|nr:hypothetical protein [Lysobacter capsici]UOF16770.1 hypothetical protein IEQ11_09085 [Lysobacter capsici]